MTHTNMNTENRVTVDEPEMDRLNVHFLAVFKFAEGLSHKIDLVFRFTALVYSQRLTSFSRVASGVIRALENSNRTTFPSMFAFSPRTFALLTNRARRWHPGFLPKKPSAMINKLLYRMTVDQVYPWTNN